jgi:uncharacterized protein YuzE
MAKAIKVIDYDFENDDLFVSDESLVKSSLDVGDFILDVSHENLICGIEVMDASENLGISKEFLDKIKSMKMSVTYKTNNVYVLLMIGFGEGERDVNVQIPLTLSLGNKISQKEVLVYG